jgi:hypothetical protein
MPEPRRLHPAAIAVYAVQALANAAFPLAHPCSPGSRSWAGRWTATITRAR